MNHLLQRYLDTFRGLSRDIWILAFVMLINRAGAMMLPFLSLYLTESKGYSLAEAGLLMSGFGIGSLFGNYLGGWLADKWRYLRVQILSLVLSGIMWMLMSLVDSFTEFTIAIFLTSLFGSFFRPANMMAIELHGKPESRTRALSLNRMAINLGFSLGPAAAGFLIAYAGYDSLFFVDGLTCWLAALVLLIGLKPKYEDLPARAQNKGSQPEPDEQSPWKDSRFLLYALSHMFVIMSFMQFFSTIPVFWKDGLGLTESYIGILMATNGIIIVILEMPLIHALEKRKNPLRWVRMGAFLILLGAASLIPGDFVILSWAYIAFITVGEILNFPFASAYVLSIANPAFRGRYMGIFSMSWSVAFIISPSAGGYIAEHFGYSWLALAMVTCSAIGLLGLTWISKTEVRGEIAGAT